MVYEKFAILHFLSLGDLYFLNKVGTVRAFDAAADALGKAAKFVCGRSYLD